MWKFIFFGLIIWLVFYLYKKNIGQSNAPETDDTIRTQGKAKTQDKNTGEVGDSIEDPIEDMVQCTTCSVHLPRSEAFLVGGNFYCSQAHIKRK